MLSILNVLFRIVIKIRNNLAKLFIGDFPVLTFFEKVIITSVGNKLSNIYKIIYSPFNICNGGLVGCKTPFIINDKFESVFSFW